MRKLHLCGGAKPEGGSRGAPGSAPGTLDLQTVFERGGCRARSGPGELRDHFRAATRSRPRCGRLVPARPDLAAPGCGQAFRCADHKLPGPHRAGIGRMFRAGLARAAFGPFRRLWPDSGRRPYGPFFRAPSESTESAWNTGRLHLHDNTAGFPGRHASSLPALWYPVQPGRQEKLEEAREQALAVQQPSREEAWEFNRIMGEKRDFAATLRALSGIRHPGPVYSRFFKSDALCASGSGAPLYRGGAFDPDGCASRAVARRCGSRPSSDLRT